MKHDESEFLIVLALKGDVSVRKIVQRLEEKGHLHHKRAWYILDKWTRKGWYAFGISLDLGWLTDDGIMRAIEQSQKSDSEWGDVRYPILANRRNTKHETRITEHEPRP